MALLKCKIGFQSTWIVQDEMYGIKWEYNKEDNF